MPQRLENVPPPPRTPSLAAEAILNASRDEPSALGCFGALALAVGLMSAAVAATIIGNEQNVDREIDRHGGSTEGRIVDSRLSSERVHGRYPTILNFRFAVSGKEHVGFSYTFDDPPPDAGAAVAVDYDVTNPDFSRVAGTRREPRAGGAQWPGAIIFSLVGLALLIYKTRFRDAHTAFRHGTPVRAKVLGVEPGPYRMFGRRPMRLSWTFELDGKRYRGFISSFDKSVLQPFANRREVIVLYLPESPGDNTLWVK